ncbi:MAG: VOC family protein [Jatrophihabitans sp.]|uniref:VOC family protein n=1 Tax=Jatrophihabitans sp. TaxID=1932789 RepID=UPI0039128E36
MPEIRFRSVVLDAPDVPELAAFYKRLLGWPATSEESDWARFEPAPGQTGLAIQLEPQFVRPSWPSDTTHQQMQLHLDLQVDDLAAASEHATRAGATLADFQPQDDVRVLLDPVGHPFCLFEQ